MNPVPMHPILLHLAGLQPRRGCSITGVMSTAGAIPRLDLRHGLRPGEFWQGQKLGELYTIDLSGGMLYHIIDTLTICPPPARLPFVVKRR
jgi:hypothetical protein